MPSRRLRRPVRPVVVVACLAGVGMLAFASLASLASAQTDSQRPAGVSAQTTGGSSSTTTTTAPSGSGSTASSGVTLNGEGAAGPYKEVTQWQNDLATAQSPINLNYTVTGSLDGRQDFLSKQADFVITGTDFCPANEGTATCPNGGFEGFLNSELTGAGLSPNQNGHESKDVIDAPVFPTALDFVDAPPDDGGFIRQDFLCDPNDPNLDDPFVCILNSPFTNELRIPPTNLAAMMLNFSGGQAHDNSWENTDVLNALGITPAQCNIDPPGGLVFPTPGYHCLDFSNGISAVPLPTLRSDADETTYYLQQYMETAAPSIWQANVNQTPGINWTPGPNSTVTERMPRQPGASREAVDDLAGQMLLTEAPANSPGGSGSIGTLPPSAMVAALLTAPPTNTLESIWVRNANGDWVDPTPASIDAAVNAGGDTPLYALTNKVRNAYPLTWVDHLYVRSSGLSAAKTEAVATLIRYLATAGQNAASSWNDGVLSSTLVTQALSAANQVVQSNCPGSGGTIVKNSDPGPDAPPLQALTSIGPMLHCQAPPSASSGSAGVQGSPTVPILSIPLLPTTAAAAGPVAATKPKHVLPAALTVSQLPIPLPGTPLDRIATFFLGVVLFLLLKNPLLRLLGKASE